VIVVDASVLIAHLDASDAQHTRAEEALLAVAGQPLGCSPVTLAEVLAGPARAGRLELADRAIADLEIAEVPHPHHAAVRLATLRARTNLKLPDCCVILAAQEATAAGVLTFDDRLAREAARLRFETP
jgi:predicted nucleic acid-binding protein